MIADWGVYTPPQSATYEQRSAACFSCQSSKAFSTDRRGNLTSGLRFKCEWSLNILNAVSGSSWDGDGAMMLTTLPLPDPLLDRPW
jgi:hypothetical protein